jgi:hypothetical protein
MEKETKHSQMEEKHGLHPIVKMRLASMDDLVRMAFFSAARNAGLNFLIFKDDKSKKWHIGFLTGVAGYFNLRGLPMYFFHILDEKPKNCKFIQYSSIESEKWSFCESTTASTKWNYLPVIQLDGKPAFF